MSSSMENELGEFDPVSARFVPQPPKFPHPKYCNNFISFDPDSTIRKDSCESQDFRNRVPVDRQINEKIMERCGSNGNSQNAVGSWR